MVELSIKAQKDTLVKPEVLPAYLFVLQCYDWKGLIGEKPEPVLCITKFALV